MKKIKPSVIFYADFLDTLDRMTDEQAAAFTKAVLRYGIYGVTPDALDDFMSGAWSALKPALDRDHEKYCGKTIAESLAEVNG